MTDRTRLLWPGVGLGLALVLLTLAVATQWSPLVRLDGWASSHAFAATYGNDGRTTAWTVVTDLGGPDPMRLLLVAVGLVALVRRSVRPGLWLVGLAVVEGVVAPASKHLLDRQRPSWPDAITVLSSTSYPSGHATAAAATALALALLARRTAVTWVCLVTAVAVAASRVFLGAHYPSDVVGGLLLGTLLALSTYAVAVKWRVTPSRSPRSPTR